MIARKLAAAAATSLTAALLLTGASSVASASTLAAAPTMYGYWAYFWGTGSTLAAAETNALQQSASYGCSSKGELVSSSESGGVWTAEMKTLCPNSS